VEDNPYFLDTGWANSISDSKRHFFPGGLECLCKKFFSVTPPKIDHEVRDLDRNNCWPCLKKAVQQGHLTKPHTVRRVKKKIEERSAAHQERKREKEFWKKL